MELRNASVLALIEADGTTDDAIVAIRRKARALIDEVRTTLGWEGPPFDPKDLASYRGYTVKSAREGFGPGQDACVTPGLIVLNLAKPPRRRRYSVAHEVVHTLFPDYEAEVRRAGALWRRDGDTDELEYLCQIGAAELLLPEFSFQPQLQSLGLSLETALRLAAEYDASTEATVRRCVDLWGEAAAAIFFRPPGSHLPNYEGYSPYQAITASLIHTGSYGEVLGLEIGMNPPKGSVVTKAWKRAGTARLASLTYSANELWSSGGLSTRRCDAMVLPKRSTNPIEVLCLLQSAT
jgi:hypothetical protein